MTDAEKLTALADDIKAGFEREPWRDQPGMGYVEIQMDKDDEAEYRAMAERSEELEAEWECARERIAQLEATLEALRRTEHCWCDVSIGNPMMREHSDACVLAQGAAKGIPGVRDTARDARMKTAGALEALKTWRAKFGHYTPGENTILDEMDAALAALEQEGANL